MASPPFEDLRELAPAIAAQRLAEAIESPLEDDSEAYERDSAAIDIIADRRVGDPAVTMWLSNVIFFGIGLILVRRMGHSGGTARGGGWSDAIAGFFGARGDAQAGSVS